MAVLCAHPAAERAQRPRPAVVQHVVEPHALRGGGGGGGGAAGAARLPGGGGARPPAPREGLPAGAALQSTDGAAVCLPVGTKGGAAKQLRNTKEAQVFLKHQRARKSLILLNVSQRPRDNKGQQTCNTF